MSVGALAPGDAVRVGNAVATVIVSLFACVEIVFAGPARSGEESGYLRNVRRQAC